MVIIGILMSLAFQTRLKEGFNPKIDIVYFLSQLKSRFGDSIYLRYFIKRYYIWYLLFSGRSASGSEFMNQYRMIKNGLDKSKWILIYHLCLIRFMVRRFQIILIHLAFRGLESLRLIHYFQNLL